MNTDGSTRADAGPEHVPRATRPSRPRLAADILTFGLGMLLAAVSIVGILIGVLQGPVWLIAAAIAALLVGLATAFLGMVLLYRALVTPASGPQPTPRKK